MLKFIKDKLLYLCCCLSLLLSFFCGSGQKVDTKKMTSIISQMSILYAEFKEKERTIGIKDEKKTKEMQKEFEKKLLAVLMRHDVTLEDFRDDLHSQIEEHIKFNAILDSAQIETNSFRNKINLYTQ